MTMTTTNEELIAEAVRVLREGTYWTLADAVAALAAVPAPTEADRDAALRTVVEAARGEMSDTEWQIAKMEPLTAYHVYDDAILAAGFHRTPVPAPKTQDGEAREALARTVVEVTDLWPEPLDEVRDIPQIVNAILARYTLVPVSPEGGETK